jgi:hypothetical protein
LRCAQAEELGGKADAVPLRFAHRFERTRDVTVRALAHLDNHERLRIEADQIELARAAAEVAGQDAKPLADEMPFGEALGGLAAEVPGIAREGHGRKHAPNAAPFTSFVSRVFAQIRARSISATIRAINTRAQ